MARVCVASAPFLWDTEVTNSTYRRRRWLRIGVGVGGGVAEREKDRGVPAVLGVAAHVQDCRQPRIGWDRVHHSVEILTRREMERGIGFCMARPWGHTMNIHVVGCGVEVRVAKEQSTPALNHPAAARVTTCRHEERRPEPGACGMRWQHGRASVGGGVAAGLPLSQKLSGLHSSPVSGRSPAAGQQPGTSWA